MTGLSESEQIVYLANAALLAHSDSSLSPRELAALEELRSKLGAKKGALNAARKAVESGTYGFSRCGGFVTQVNNLADMLYVCVVDGEFADKERVLASDFSKSIGLIEAQFELMVKNVLDHHSKPSFTVTCPQCSTTASAKSKFCPNCGAPLSKPLEESVKTDFEIPAVGHAIEFPQSSASNFRKALAVAKKAPSFQTCIRGKKNWYLAEWPEESFSDVAHLARILGGIRNLRYYHDGSEAPMDEIFAFAWCAEQRHSAYRPIEYCFGKNENKLNPWGCKQIGFDWEEWAPWFTYGQFKKTGALEDTYTWVFDKDRIRHEVMSNLHTYRTCPHLRPDLVDAVLEALPEEVEISPASGWEYTEGREEIPGSIKVVNIKKYDDRDFDFGYFSNGVHPTGLSTLEQVLTKAFAAARVSDIKVKQLVR